MNFPIRMYHLYERNAHVSYRTDLGMVMNMEEAHSWCTFYEPINPVMLWGISFTWRFTSISL